MRNEGKVALVLVILIVGVAAVYFFRSGREKPIELGVGQKAGGVKVISQKTGGEELPLPVDLSSAKSKGKQKEVGEEGIGSKAEGVQEEGVVASSEPAISKVEVDDGGQNGEISIDLGAPSSEPASSQPAVEKAEANQPAKIELDLASKKDGLEEADSGLSEEKGAEGVSEQVSGEKTVYIVKPGDTLYDIAKKYYGRGELWTIIAKANPLINPDRLLVGQKLEIPSKVEAEDGYESEASLPAGVDRSQVRAYRVKKGESFYTIARDELGDASRWREIFRLNKSAVKGDPRRLKAGQLIYLPKE